MGAFDRLSEGETIPLSAFFLYAGQLNTLIEQTGWVARVVLGMLLAFSLFSWALIFQKLFMFSRIKRQTSGTTVRIRGMPVSAATIRARRTSQ